MAQWTIDGISRVIRNFKIHRFDCDEIAERKADAEWCELTQGKGILHSKPVSYTHLTLPTICSV